MQKVLRSLRRQRPDDFHGPLNLKQSSVKQHAELASELVHRLLIIARLEQQKERLSDLGSPLPIEFGCSDEGSKSRGEIATGGQVPGEGGAGPRFVILAERCIKGASGRKKPCFPGGNGPLDVVMGEIDR
jgi:hypothetical protein